MVVNLSPSTRNFSLAVHAPELLQGQWVAACNVSGVLRRTVLERGVVKGAALGGNSTAVYAITAMS